MITFFLFKWTLLSQLQKKKKTTNIKDIFDRNSSVNTGIIWTAEKGKKHMLPYNAEPYFDVRHPVT